MDPVRRTLVGAVLSVMLVAAVWSAPPASGVAGFGDVDGGQFFTQPVQWMVDNDITTGTSPTCFSPRGAVTRGQAAAFLWRMAGSPAPGPRHPFSDVSASWQQDPVSWMYDQKITTGTSPTKYSPDDHVTRAQLAAMLHRLEGSPPAPPPTQFTDVWKSWQITPVGWLLDNDITTGTSPNEFSPERSVTRGEAATFLYRYEGSPAVVVDPESPQCGSPRGQAIGFGAGATGGAVPCVVTSLANSGAGTLRDCAEEGGTLVTFAVSGTIDLSGEIDVASNTTINGFGQNVTIVGMLDIKEVHNVVVRHLRITGSGDDAIRVIRSHTMWFDHLDMSDAADGLIDITSGSTDATISWSHFHDHDKMVLINPGKESGVRARVTLHHNWFDHGGRRYPSAETSDIHGFNNFYDGWSVYGVQISEGARFVSEHNVYAGSGDPDALKTNVSGEGPGEAVSFGDIVQGNVVLELRGSAFTPPYSYSLDPASTVIGVVTTRTGPNR